MKILKPRTIAEARRLRDDRQADVAAKLGVSQQYISRVERGVEKECSPQFARLLCRYLDIDIDEVFDLETTPRIRHRIVRKSRRTRVRKSDPGERAAS